MADSKKTADKSPKNEDQDGLFDKVMNDSKLKTIAIGILLVILIAAGTFLVANQNDGSLSAEEQELINSAFNIADLDSGVIQISASGSGGESGDFDVNGEIQFADNKYLIEADVTIEGTPYKGAIYIGDDTALFKITGIEDVLVSALSLGTTEADQEILNTFTAYEDQWVLLTSTDLSGIGLPEIPEVNDLVIEDADVADLRNTIENTDFFDLTMISETRMIGETTLTGYQVTIDPAAAQDLANELDSFASDTSETLDNSFDTSELDLSSETIESLTVWTDGEYLRAIEITETAEDGSEIKIDIELTSVNPDLVLTPPNPESSLEDILEEFFGSLFSGFGL